MKHVLCVLVAAAVAVAAPGVLHARTSGQSEELPPIWTLTRDIDIDPGDYPDLASPYRIEDWPPLGSIGLYVDPDAVQWCFSGTQYTMFDLYYVIIPDIYGVRAVEFKTIYPPNLSAIATDFDDFYAVALGEPTIGIAISYNSCLREPHWAMHQTMIALSEDPSTITLDTYPAEIVLKIDVATCFDPYRPIRDLYRRTDLDFNWCGGYVWPAMLDSVTVDGPDALTLHFADPVEASEAEDPNDFLILNRLDSLETIGVASAAVLGGGHEVALTLSSPFVSGHPYVLEVNDDADSTKGCNVFRTGTGLCPDLVLQGMWPAVGVEHDNERFPVRFLIRNGGGADSGPFTVDLVLRHWLNTHYVVLGTYSDQFDNLEPGESVEWTICTDLTGYASRFIDFYGSVGLDAGPDAECYLGNNEYIYQRNIHTPRLLSVEDVPDDEGGWVRLIYQRALTDVDPSATVALTVAYEFYRRQSGGTPPDCGCEPGPCGEWEHIRTIEAEGTLTYSKWAETPCDLAPLFPDCVFDFLVCAVELTGAGDTIRHWSEVRTGSSIDNLAPARPTGFAGVQQGEDLYLRWDPNGEPDFDTYRLYRSASVYGPWTLIDEFPGTEYIDEDWYMGSGYCYRLTAVDVHGNESDGAVLTPEGMVATLLAGFSAVLREYAIALDWALSVADEGLVFHVLRSQGEGPFEEISAIEARPGALEFSFVDDGVSFGEVYRYRIEFELEGARRVLVESDRIETPEMPLTLHQNAPNPFNPSTAISFYLPAPADARLDIFDVSGRRVAALLDGRLAKGTHRVEWDGRDSRGRQTVSGIYFCRLVVGKEVLTKKMVLLR